MKKKDLLWKGAIRDLFPDFMLYFFEGLQPGFDLDKGYEFLDKELEQVLPESEAQDRRADILAKLHSPAGEEFWFLVHVEVQGYHDEDFAQRMYTIQYRIYERFQKPVAALAILTDNRPGFHPKSFGYQCLGTKLDYQFQTYKVLEHPPEKLKHLLSNPFAIIMETAWQELKMGKKADEARLNAKIRLLKKLLAHGYPKATIRTLFDFIKYYMAFAQSDFYLKFDEKTNPMKNTAGMTLREMIIEDARQEGIKIGMEKGREEGREEGVVLSVPIQLLLLKGLAPEEVAQKLDADIHLVRKIKAELDRFN